MRNEKGADLSSIPCLYYIYVHSWVMNFWSLFTHLETQTPVLRKYKIKSGHQKDQHLNLNRVQLLPVAFDYSLHTRLLLLTQEQCSSTASEC